MKRIAITMLMLLAVLGVGAQEIMMKHRSKGDPMLGTDPYTYWESRHVFIMEGDNGAVGMTIMNPRHVFTSETTTRIGFYSANGKLILATEGWRTTMETGSLAMYLQHGYTSDTTSVYCRMPGEKEYGEAALRKITKQNIVDKEHVLKFLKETNGYIRIVSPIYYGGYFDVKAKLKK